MAVPAQGLQIVQGMGGQHQIPIPIMPDQGQGLFMVHLGGRAAAFRASAVQGNQRPAARITLLPLGRQIRRRAILVPPPAPAGGRIAAPYAAGRPLFPPISRQAADNAPVSPGPPLKIPIPVILGVQQQPPPLPFPDEVNPVFPAQTGIQVRLFHPRSSRFSRRPADSSPAVSDTELCPSPFP